MADANVFWYGVIASLIFLMAGLFIHFGLGYALDTFLYNYPHGSGVTTNWENSTFYKQVKATGGVNETINQLYMWGYFCYLMSAVIMIQSVWRRSRQDQYIYPGR